MKKLILFLVISLLVFGNLSLAREPEEQIEKSIAKLKQVKGLLEKEDKSKAISILTEAKTHTTRALLSLLGKKSGNKIASDKWIIKIPANPITETTYQSSRDMYFIEMGEVTVENLTERTKSFYPDIYLLDPKGIQRSMSLLSGGSVLPGAIKFYSWFGLIEKSKFVSGTYTLLIKHGLESEPEELRFHIELSEENFSE